MLDFFCGVVGLEITECWSFESNRESDHNQLRKKSSQRDMIGNIETDILFKCNFHLF